MKSITLLLCVVACLAFARPDISYVERSLEPRATTCDNNNNNNNNRQICSSAGNQCTRDCSSCRLTYTNCTANVMNETMRCDCETSFVNCLATFKNPSFACNSSDAYNECKADLPTCGCGTPYTVDNTVYICESNTYCDQSSGRCASVKAAGQSCKTSDECGDVNGNPLFTQEYNCTNNKCQVITKSWPGDACSSNSDCRFYAQYNLGCVSGTCASQKDGSECPVYESTQVCGATLYCDEDNICRNVLSIGESCNATTRSDAFSVCGLTGICSASTCVNYLSKNQDQACQYDEECAEPLYCSQSKGVCAQPLDNPVCNSDLYCTQLNPDYYGCECDAGATSPTCQSNADTKCTQQALNFLKCAQANNCVASENYIPGGCADVNCRQELECYADCSGATQIYDAFCIVGYTSTCPSVSFADRNQVYSWAVAASVVVAVFMF